MKTNNILYYISSQLMCNIVCDIPAGMFINSVLLLITIAYTVITSNKKVGLKIYKFIYRVHLAIDKFIN